jgi:hypothetical protein
MVPVQGAPDGGTAPDAPASQVPGRLAPDVIQRVVRQSFNTFRACYEDGLRRDPKLRGLITVRFVIGSDGRVTNVGNGGSDMPDGGVVSCVVRGFYGLSFPQPEGGIVTVTYPIMFSPQEPLDAGADAASASAAPP